MGDFVKADLPNGLNFPVLLEEKWFENPEFEVEVRTNGGVFAGILDMGMDTPTNKNLSISGTATVYNTRNPAENISMECTILVEDPIRAEPEKIEEKTMATRETQTEKERKSVGIGETQTDPPPLSPPPTVTSEASTMTDAPHLTLESLQPILTSSIARHLKEQQKKKEGVKEDVVIEDPKPQGIQNFQGNSFNLYPRIGKLKDLDAMIKQKEDYLERLNSEIEMKRKLKFVIEKRNQIAKDSEDVKKEDVGKISDKKYEEKSGKKSEHPAPEPSAKPEKSEVSTSRSSTSESTSKSSSSKPTSSESTSSSESDSESSTSSETSSSSSPPSSQETVRAAPVSNKAASDGESTIEDPFSARHSDAPSSSEIEVEVPVATAPIGPDPAVTAYLEEMKRRMMTTGQKRYL